MRKHPITPARKTLVSACTLAALSWSLPGVSDDVLTTFTLTDENASVGEVGFDHATLSQHTFDNGGFSGGDTTYRFVSQGFRPASSGDFTFGQTSAPFDSAMIVYAGTFDPTNPGANLLAFNDDSDLFAENACFEGETGSNVRCPAVQEQLERGQEYTIVILPYNPARNELVDFPLSFFVLGPSGVMISGDYDDLFELPVTGLRAQPVGAYLDRTLESLLESDPSGELLEALVAQAELSDADRAKFVESFSSEVALNANRNATINASRAVLDVVGTRLVRSASTANRSLSSLDNVSSALSEDEWRSGESSWNDVGLPGEARSLGNNPRSQDGLLGMAHGLAFQSDTSPGQLNLWAQGYVTRGDGENYDYRTYGAMVGIDQQLSEHWLAGTFVGMGRTNIEGSDIAAAETDTDSLLLGVYTAGYFGNFIVDATLMGHRGDNDHERSIASATPEIVTGSNESDDVTLALGGRYVIQLSEAWKVVPNAEVAHSWLSQSSYEEGGSSAFTLDYGSQDQRVWRTSVGVDSGYLVSHNEVSQWALTGGLAWGVRQASDGDVRAALPGGPGGDSFVVTPDNDTLHTLEVSAGARWDRQLASGTVVSVSGVTRGPFRARR